MRLTFTNAGPHAALAIDIPDDGVTEILGHSRAGKSAMVSLFFWVLYGTDEHGRAVTESVLREGAPAKSVASGSITWKNGTTVTRTLKGKTVTRTVARPGQEPIDCGTEADLRAQLGKTLLGTDPEATRCILAPGVWQRLAAGKLGGVDLRNVLGRILPKGDLRGEVAALMTAAGHSMQAHDPTDPKIAEDRRKDAKREASEATGRLAQARASLVAIEADVVPAPSESDIIAAKRLLILGTAWETYEAQDGHYRRAETNRAAQVTARENWRTRKAALGERPAYDATAETAASVAVEDAERALRTAEQAQREAERARAAEDATRAAEARAEDQRVKDEARHEMEMARARAEDAAEREARAQPVTGALFAPVAGSTGIPTVRTFTRAELLNDLDLPGGKNQIEAVITGHGRWDIDYDLYFRTPELPAGQAWCAGYSVGATERQDTGPWENEETVEATLYHRITRPTEVWERVLSPFPVGVTSTPIVQRPA